MRFSLPLGDFTEIATRTTTRRNYYSEIFLVTNASSQNEAVQEFS